MKKDSFLGIRIPIPKENKEHRELLIAEDVCPECGGELDTGWECNECGFDAMPELMKETT